MANTIILEGDPLYKEYDAAGVVTPGDLLEVNTDKEVVVHNSAGENHARLFALADELVGKDIDEDYASGDRVRCVYARPGDLIYATLANGENVDEGEWLESAGNGHLQAHTPQAVDEGGSSTYNIYASGIVGVVEEAANASGGATRVKVRVV